MIIGPPRLELGRLVGIGDQIWLRESVAKKRGSEKKEDEGEGEEEEVAATTLQNNEAG